MKWIINNEENLRLICFLSVLAIMCLWEVLAPRKARTSQRSLRWPNNIALVILNTVLLRFLFPVAAVSMAHISKTQGMGLFNIIEAPFFIQVIASILLLDLLIYLQHIMFHKVGFFWRLHRVHHADVDIDVTTGSRFHPIEIFLSMGLKIFFVMLIGPPIIAVILFEIILNATAMFNHSNVRIPIPLDKLLRLLVVTPDMHRVHHSVIQRETDSNYGFNVPWWDRIFRTYNDQPQEGHDQMTIGLKEFPDPKKTSPLHHMLLMPFKKDEKI